MTVITRRWSALQESDPLPERQGHIVQPHGVRCGVDVGVELESGVQAAGGVGVVRHAQVDDGAVSVDGHSGEDHVARRIAFEFPDQMVPGIGRRHATWKAGSDPCIAGRIPHAPHLLPDQQALHVVTVAIPAGTLTNSELERLRRRVVDIKGQVIDKMGGCVEAAQIVVPEHPAVGLASCQQLKAC